MNGFKTDDPDLNGNRLTGYWGGNGDPYLTIIEADTEDNIKGMHPVRVAFSGGNFPSDLKCMVGLLVNMIKRYEPYIDEQGRFNGGKYIADCYHKKVKDSSCGNFIHEADMQAYAYRSAKGQHSDVYMLGCAVGIKWALEKIQGFIDSPDCDDDFLKMSLRMKIMEMLKTE